MALLLAAGLIVHGFDGPDAIAKSATTTGDMTAGNMSTSGDMVMSSNMPASTKMPVPGKCNGCAGDEKGMAPAACFAFCGAVIAVPAAAVVLYAIPAEMLNPASTPDTIGRSDPPDPYPPRPIILS